MTDIIKKAIADARAVQNVAQERAKDMFIKEFSPKIKSLLTSVINEEVSTGNNQPGGYNPDEDKDAIGVTTSQPGKNINKNAGAGSANTFPKASDVNEEDEPELDDEDEPIVEIEDDEDIDDEDEIYEINDDDEIDDEEEPIVEIDDDEDIDDEDEIYEIDNDDENDDEEEVIEIVDDEIGIDDEDDELSEINDIDDIDDEDDELSEIDDIDDEDDELNMNKKVVVETLKRKNHRLFRENKNLREAIGVLKNKFKKINLFNAKLAYAFKLMTQPGLTRNEKKQIAETFDSAKTVREAQLIYKSIKRSYKNPARTTRNILVNKNVKSVLSEQTKNETANRLTELAGI